MCGFLLNISGKKLTPKLINDVNNSLYTRGPDDNGYLSYNTLSGNKVDMIHTRLEISGLGQSGYQPMENNKYIILFNGEIYNHLELSKLLGKNYKNKGDTKVLLDLFTKFGISNTLKRITGIFSICILDKERETLYLHRDIFATKPLYFYLKDNKLTVSSNVKSIAIVQEDNKVGNLSEYGELFFLLFGFTFISKKTTHEISELNPGSLYQIDINTLKIKCTKIDCSSLEGFNLINWEKEIIDSYNAEVPISILLSGGVDSTFLASLNKKSINKNISTFTLSNSSGSNFSDVSKAKKIASYLNLNNTKIKIDSNNIKEEFQDFIRNMEYPTDDGLNIYLATKYISNKKIKVCLTGLGGDEFFNGYSSSKTSLFKAILRNSFIWRFLPFLKKIIYKNGFGGYLKFLRINPSTISGYLYGKAFIFDKMPIKKIDFIIDIFAKDLKKKLPNKFLRRFSYFNRVSLLEIYAYCIPQLVKDSDTFGMANSVEVRPSLLVKSLFHKLLNNNLNDKKFSGKKILISKLDRKITSFLNNNKQGFTIDIERFLRSDFAEISEIILKDKNNFKYESILREFKNNFSKKKNTHERKKYFIWRLYILSLWKSLDKAEAIKVNQ